MRIDCHFHTNQYSCCSHVSPQRACALALSRGLNALLFTEHGRYWPEDKLAELQAEFPTLKLYSGVEIALAEGYHVVAFGSRFLEKQTHFMTLPELRGLVAENRGNIFLFVAHAFRYHPYPTIELLSILNVCDGLEMNSINILRGNALTSGARIVPANHARYQKYLRGYGLAPLYNTDGHDEDIVGVIANELSPKTPPDNEVDLVRLFRQEQSREFQNPTLLSQHHLLNVPELS